MAAPIGGDEFAVQLPHTTQQVDEISGPMDLSADGIEAAKVGPAGTGDGIDLTRFIREADMQMLALGRERIVGIIDVV